jgi:DNA-binding NtrC family response regulator
MVAAASSLPALVLGESGTGKDIVARAIHKFSKRSGPFCDINCAAIPTELLESELFGHLKGSAANILRDRPGLWQHAQNGTLFLDEVGDLALQHQAKILRALEANEVRPVGSDTGVKVNARIIAATNGDLQAMVQSGRFREDLYYRLNHLVIRTPSLRDNPEDIAPLAEALWRGVRGREQSHLSPDVKEYLRLQPWPNNVRGLKRALEAFDALHGGVEPTAAKMDFVLNYLDHRHTPHPGPTEASGSDPYRHECLRQLDRAGEVVRSCRVAVRPILRAAPPAGRKDRKAVREELDRLLGELEVSCQRPHLLAGAYDAVSELKDRLYAFVRLLPGDLLVTKADWKREAHAAYEAAQTAVSAEFSRLMQTP